MQCDRREFGLEWDEGLYVTGNAVTGANMSPMVLGKDWRSLARALHLKGTQGERPCFHDLRHTFATLAIASGVDVKTAGVILGHADAQVTLNVYADALADTKRSSMDMIDKVLSTRRAPRRREAHRGR